MNRKERDPEEGIRTPVNITFNNKQTAALNKLAAAARRTRGAFVKDMVLELIDPLLKGTE